MARIAICNCPGCMNIGTQAHPMPNRGGRMAWLCDFHAFDLESYYRENNNRIGNAKQHNGTSSIELETSFSDDQARAELLNAGFIPTSDCTVDVEYKSSIYEGLNALSKQCVTIDRLVSEGRLVMGPECGTHYHYGHREWINPATMGWIIEYYEDLFRPMDDLLHEMSPDQVADFFGRDLTDRTHMEGQSGGSDGYAQSLYYGDPETHENWINVQHDWTIEFRICKYRDHEQYMEIARTIKGIGEALVTDFIKHYNDEKIDKSRYKNIDAWRKHCAKKAGDKMRRKLEKAMNK